MNSNATGDWNPHYVAYARAHGKSPGEMLRQDKTKWPGGRMSGFLIWMSEGWSEWHTKHDLRRYEYIVCEKDLQAFVCFLPEKNHV